jgi:hypothetical protein
MSGGLECFCQKFFIIHAFVAVGLGTCFTNPGNSNHDDNSLTAEAFCLILDGLERNSTLTSLSLDDCKIFASACSFSVS